MIHLFCLDGKEIGFGTPKGDKAVKRVRKLLKKYDKVEEYPYSNSKEDIALNPFSHIDLRVTNLEQALPFYERFLSQLGFAQTFHSVNWKVFSAEGNLPSVAYFAITEDPSHKPNGNLIGFWAESREEVDRLAQLVTEIGGKITSGPQQYPISPTYYVVYFEDPCGNQL